MSTIAADLNLDANVTLLGIIFNADGTLNSNTSDITIPPFVGTSIANSTAVFTFTVSGLVSGRISLADSILNCGVSKCVCRSMLQLARGLR